MNLHYEIRILLRKMRTLYLMCRIFFEEQEISLKRESSFISLLSSYGSCFRKTLINNDLDDINDSCKFQNAGFELFINLHFVFQVPQK